MEVELKEMLNDLDYLKKSLSNPSNLASSIHKTLLNIENKQEKGDKIRGRCLQKMRCNLDGRIYCQTFWWA
ncbi:hypothetical protein NC651_033072 [Populus alba x Populus x berolinensis]|nr:hypothetical protein NC651_033072 [Populus alba x Populus x berolinensis]